MLKICKSYLKIILCCIGTTLCQHVTDILMFKLGQYLLSIVFVFIK